MPKNNGNAKEMKEMQRCNAYTTRGRDKGKKKKKRENYNWTMSSTEKSGGRRPMGLFFELSFWSLLSIQM